MQLSKLSGHKQLIGSNLLLLNLVYLYLWFVIITAEQVYSINYKI